MQAATPFSPLENITPSKTVPVKSSLVILSPYFPPSPPLSNSGLSHHISLPFVLGNHCSHLHSPELVDEWTGGMEFVGYDRVVCSERCIASGVAELPSPPNSPRRRALTLLEDDMSDQDFRTEMVAHELPPTSPIERQWHDNRWSNYDEDKTELSDLPLLEKEDDWDDPLFLDAPSADDTGDILDLTLLEGDQPQNTNGPSSLFSKVISGQSEDLPSGNPLRSDVVDLHQAAKDTPLFDPSHFNVFENGWDRDPSSSFQSSNICNVTTIKESDCSPPSPPTVHHSGIVSHQPILFNFDNRAASLTHIDPLSYAFSEPHTLISPPSPSRRNVLELSDSRELALTQQSLPQAQPMPSSISLQGSLGNPELDLFFSPSSRHFPSLEMLCDVATDIFQSPFPTENKLPHSSTSLLFSPLGAEGNQSPSTIHLQICELSSSESESDDIPLVQLEEGKLRALRQRCIAKEQQAKVKETALTEYIARLNAMPAPMSTTVQCAVPGGHTTMFLPCSYSDDNDGKEESGPGPASLSFQEMRFREVQAASAARSVERTKRKRAKERVRELGALLLLKSGQMRPTSQIPKLDEIVGEGFAPAAFPTRLSDEQDAIAPNGFSTDMQTGDKIRGSLTHGQDLLRLVAKMFFRRRDSPRNLAGRSLPSPDRHYVSSSLSQETLAERDDQLDGSDVAS